MEVSASAFEQPKEPNVTINSISVLEKEENDKLRSKDVIIQQQELAKKVVLPHETSTLFLTDGGVITTLIFIKGFDLPCLAFWNLLQSEKGYQALQDYQTGYLNLAKRFKTGYVLESPTWRASPDWIAALGYPPSALKEINTKAIQMIKDTKVEYENQLSGPIVISAVVGPRGDGYQASYKMDPITAQQYHSAQISLFKELGGVNMVSAFTLSYVEEAIGIVKACNDVQLPCVISFTLESNGQLPSGMPLKDAIETIDTSVDVPPIYYAINCAHPKHFIHVLEDAMESNWVKRIRAIRGNASCKSHAELNESTSLDKGNVDEFSHLYKVLKEEFPHMNVFGGCCGTDEEHIEAVFNQLKQ